MRRHRLSQAGLAQIRVIVALTSSVCMGAGIWASASSSPSKVNAKIKAVHKKKIDFNRDVRPILDKCLACHGHDPKAVQAGLRLDNRAGATKTLADGVRAIIPGNPDQSMLIQRIESNVPEILMPPPSSHKILSADDKKILREWIAEGAEFKKHWAFVKPVRPTVPKVENASWPHNDIDNFVEEKLEDNGLRHSPDADRSTLIRRVSLDLVGLPPTPAETAAFVADKSPNAYSKVVDRLLASPLYGERMAMEWMDDSRYADSNGYQADYERFQYRWRDWVIDAFNKNMPYDVFTVDQLAGDLLPHPTRDQIIATGFNRNHRINTEGGVIPEEWRVETVIDRVETTSAVWLGLTTGCARCHDHKYDPITQKDFYSLCSYFNNVPESGTGVEQPVNHPPLISAPYPQQAAQQVTLSQEIATLKAQVTRGADNNLGEAERWKPSDGVDATLPQAGQVARYTLGAESVANKTSVPVPDNNGSVSGAIGRSTGAVNVGDKGFVDLGNVGDFEKNEPFSVGAWINPSSNSGSPIARMDVSDAYRGWDIMLADGRPAFHMIHAWPDDALKVISKTTLPMGQWSSVWVSYDGTGKASGVHIYVNGQLTPQDVEIDHLTGTIHSKANLRIGRRQNESFFSGQVDDLGVYRRALTSSEINAIASLSPAAPLLRIPVAQRTAEQRATLAELWSREYDPAYKATSLKLQSAVDDQKKLDESISTVMVMQEMPKPRDCYVLIRGQYDHHGAKVTAAVPASLPPLPEGVPNNRLGLAKWIVDPSNPLTARVTVNRMWERLFGTGIVATSDDFGTRAEFPSHPELLDWLATELIRNKWNLKTMWKEMVMSRTYRQSSNVSAALEKLDPQNRLLARGPRFRLPAEVIRDQAMFAGGYLTEKIGGPSVRPYQPAGVWDDISVYGNLHHYKHDMGADLYRRSLYTIWKRTAAPPEMTLFDAPSREVCRVKRARTDTPLQALVLLNDETYLEAARALAQRMLEHGGHSVSARIGYGFRLLLGRNPNQAEESILARGIQKRIVHFSEKPKEAVEFLKEGELPTDPKLKPDEVAAYTVAASTMLNLDETVTKE
jgi:hypothetical protein